MPYDSDVSSVNPASYYGSLSYFLGYQAVLTYSAILNSGTKLVPDGFFSPVQV